LKLKRIRTLVLVVQILWPYTTLLFEFFVSFLNLHNSWYFLWKFYNKCTLYSLVDCVGISNTKRLFYLSECHFNIWKDKRINNINAQLFVRMNTNLSFFLHMLLKFKIKITYTKWWSWQIA